MVRMIRAWTAFVLLALPAGANEMLSPNGALLIRLVDSTHVAFDLLALPDTSATMVLLGKHLAPLRAAGEQMERARVTIDSGIRFKRGGLGQPSGQVVEVHLQAVKKAWNTKGRDIRGVAGARFGGLSAPFTEVQDLQLRQVLDDNQQVLKRFERKYGEGSAQLNGVETIVNYFLLRDLDGIGMDEAGVPGSYELISSYTTSYLRFKGTDEELAQSGLELGLRRYIFTDGWGTSVWKPAYFALGVLVTGERPGVLEDPFRDQRWGAFLSWGNVKTAYVFSDDAEWLISRELKFVPGLF